MNNITKSQRQIALLDQDLVLSVRPVTVERRKVEFPGIDDVAVQLADGFGPRVGTDGDVIHAEAAALWSSFSALHGAQFTCPSPLACLEL